jgi:hypothetical protein
MRRAAIIPLWLALVAGQGRLAAENPAIAAIRSHYQAVQSRIASADAMLWCDTIATNTGAVPSPGTGPVRKWVRLYSEVVYPETESSAMDLVLVKAENTTQMMDTVFYEEYLFFPDGALVFYHRKRGLGDAEDLEGLKVRFEERFYFSGGTLIRTLIDGVLSDSPDAQERASGEAILRKAQAIRSLQSLRAMIPHAGVDVE